MCKCPRDSGLLHTPCDMLKAWRGWIWWNNTKKAKNGGKGGRAFLKWLVTHKKKNRIQAHPFAQGYIEKDNRRDHPFIPQTRNILTHPSQTAKNKGRVFLMLWSPIPPTYMSKNSRCQCYMFQRGTFRKGMRFCTLKDEGLSIFFFFFHCIGQNVDKSFKIIVWKNTQYKIPTIDMLLFRCISWFHWIFLFS